MPCVRHGLVDWIASGEYTVVCNVDVIGNHVWMAVVNVNVTVCLHTEVHDALATNANSLIQLCDLF